MFKKLKFFVKMLPPPNPYRLFSRPGTNQAPVFMGTVLQSSPFTMEAQKEAGCARHVPELYICGENFDTFDSNIAGKYSVRT